jgi:hypothetical protein
MKRLLLLGALFLCFAFAYRQLGDSLQDPSEKICNLPQNWASPIGNVSFRTNIANLNGNIVIGSNGGNYMDYFIDKGNGVYVLDPVTGKIKRSFANERFGDMDVNGVLVYNNNIYFGNDNDEIICADSQGKIIFRQDASGDIEHRPILLNSPTGDQIVFAMETGEVRSINPSTGAINWTYYHPEFEGYKSNDNRTAFKLKMHFYSGDRFFLEPKIVDINNDKINDLIYIADGVDIHAIDGKNGKLIFRINNDTSDNFYGTFHANLFRSNPALLETKNGTFLIIPFECRFEGDYIDEKTKNQLRFYSLTGQEVKRVDLPKVRSTSYMTQKGNLVFFSNHYIDFSEGIDQFSVAQYDASIYNKYLPPRVAEKTLTINGDECLLMSFEYGFKNHSSDESDLYTSIGIFNLSKKSFEEIHHTTVTSEFVPVLGDFNKDNKVDFLLGCHNGTLYNFDLGLDTKTIKQ